MSNTALDLISSSLRLINVLAAGETCPIATANDALQVFNDMIDSWNTMRLAIYTTRTDDFPLVLSQQSYTCGAGGNFNMPRPPQIDGMSSILNYSSNYPVEVPITMYTVDQWQNQVPVKNVTGSFPLICYDDGGFPLRTLTFWPIQSTGTVNSIRIYSWQALVQAATLATVITMPPGYRQAFRFNLAQLLGAEFNASVPAPVSAIAVESLGRVKALNMPDLNMGSDLLPSPVGYNYRSDLFGLGF